MKNKSRPTPPEVPFPPADDDDKHAVGSNGSINASGSTESAENGSVLSALQSTAFSRLQRLWNTPEVERMLLPAAIETNIAHVKMLGDTTIISGQIAADVIAALEQIRRETRSGASLKTCEKEDVYDALHCRLQEIVGELADVVKVAKSQNDQMATDIRLWLREACDELFQKILNVRKLLVDLTRRDIEVIMPGYTHMQPAVPILLSHWWLANELRLRRDYQRLQECRERFNALPLGACQLAGTNRPIDRDAVAKALNFDRVMENSLDAVSDRDFLIEFASAASIIGVHVSQMGSELLLWATQEFGFVRLPRNFVVQSPNMPQKKNPELLEILRSRPGVLNGRLQEFLTHLKGLSISYSQDLIECLPGLLDIVDNLFFMLELIEMILPALKFDTVRMALLASKDMTNASHAVDYLVEKDIPADKASKIVESIVTYCKERSKSLPDLTLNEWALFSPAFFADIYDYVSLEQSVDSRTSYGGTGSEQVELSLNAAEEVLHKDLSALEERRAKRLNLPLSKK